MAARARSSQRRQRRIVGLAAGLIVLVLAGLVAVSFLRGSGSTLQPGTPVPPAVLEALTSVPPPTFAAVGRGTASLPAAVREPVRRNSAGLPLVTYIGAEYCPFCAAERWPLVVALSRFGEFANLHLTRSAADDIYPSTPTFTFVGATYSSPTVALEAVETQGNTRVNGRYPPLQTPTAAQQQLLRTYDAPPYVPASSAGGIPFLDVAGQYVLVGASYDTGLLQGRSWEDIAGSLSDPNTPTARAVVGAANVLTAAICTATESQPAEVCGQDAVRALAGTLQQIASPSGTR